MGIVVEVVARNGSIIRSQTFKGNNVRIGRAYDCDVILSDVHVEPEHLVIHLDESTQRLSCQDLNSMNGSWLLEPSRFKGLHKNKRPIHSDSPIFSGQAVLLGRTYLRVYSSAHWVAPTQALSAWEDFGHFLGSYWLVVLLSLLVVILEVWDSYLNAPQIKKIVEYAVHGVYGLFAVIGYSLIWMAVSKSTKHDGKLFTHISVGLLTIIVIGIVSMVLPVVVYAFGLWGWQAGIQRVLMLLIGYCSLSATLIFASNLRRNARNAFALFIPLAFLIPFALKLITKSDFQGRPEYDNSLARPIWFFRKPVSSDQFLRSAQELYGQDD